MNIDYLSELHTTPVPRKTMANWLGKKVDKIKLVQDFAVIIDKNIILVPEGYVTDGASIPRFFHMMWHPFVTEARKASCIHDYIYSHLYNEYDKKFADLALKEVMLHEGATKLMAWLFYRAVRLNYKGGGWNK